MAFERLSPIHSTHEDEPELADAIDSFVLGLGEWIDALQDLQATGDLGAVRDSAAAHAAEARRVGYPVLAEAADEVCEAAKQAEGEATRKTISGLIELVQRIRLGHRSAA